MIALEPLVDDGLLLFPDAAPVVMAPDSVAQAPDQSAAARQGVARVDLTAVHSLATEAIGRLSLVGFDDAQLAALKGIDIQLVDLPGWAVATTTGTGIVLDQDAAGRGWFIDESPTDDREFSGEPSSLLADGGPAQDRIDLLSVLAHEFGHYLGLGHEPASAGAPASDRPWPLDVLMQEGIRPGARLIAANPDLASGPGVPTLLADTPQIGEALTITPTIRWNVDGNGFWDGGRFWMAPYMPRDRLSPPAPVIVARGLRLLADTMVEVFAPSPRRFPV
jgi:hypothetical protein